MSCRPFEVAAAAAATATPVPLEAQVQAPPQQPILPPENPLPPEKVEPLVGQVVLPNVVTVTPSPTPPPKAEVIPVPPPACLAPPVLFDPPDGKNFAARNTIFRWKPGDELKPDQVYDILVSTDGGKSFKSIGTTRDTILPIDFLKWDLAGVTGNFSWTVRVKDSSGKYVSCEDKWFMMSLTDIPPAGNPAPVGPPCVPGYNVKCP